MGAKAVAVLAGAVSTGVLSYAGFAIGFLLSGDPAPARRAAAWTGHYGPLILLAGALLGGLGAAVGSRAHPRSAFGRGLRAALIPYALLGVWHFGVALMARGQGFDLTYGEAALQWALSAGAVLLSPAVAARIAAGRPDGAP